MTEAALPPAQDFKTEKSDKLDKLAADAAKTVGEFNALLADVESRSRNQRVLLERYYEKGILQADDLIASPTNSLPRLQVECEIFGFNYYQVLRKTER